MTETLWQQNFSTIAEQAKAWKAEQDARPISQTEKLLGQVYQSAREVASVAYDLEHLARKIREERVVSEADADEIRNAISSAKNDVLELNKLLNLAEFSLGAIVEAGN